MKLEHQVVSLDLAKRLKELGVEQESLFVWLQRKPETADEEPQWYLKHNGDWPVGMKVYNYAFAFTVAELGEILPKYTASYQDRLDWCIDNAETDPSKAIALHAKTEADARAQMLIYLLENNLIQL